jgi:hypothetical protein
MTVTPQQQERLPAVRQQRRPAAQHARAAVPAAVAAVVVARGVRAGQCDDAE